MGPTQWWVTPNRLSDCTQSCMMSAIYSRQPSLTVDSMCHISCCWLVVLYTTAQQLSLFRPILHSQTVGMPWTNSPSPKFETKLQGKYCYYWRYHNFHKTQCSIGEQEALLLQRNHATRLSVEILQLQNIPIVWHYLRDPTFSRFYTIPEWDRHTHTDRRTNRYTTTACTALSIASHGKNRPYCTAHQV